MGVRHHSLLQSSYPSVHAPQPPWSAVPLALIQPCEVQARAKGSVPPSCTRGPDVHLRLSCCRRWIWWVSRYHVTSKPISPSENVKDLKKKKKSSIFAMMTSQKEKLAFFVMSQWTKAPHCNVIEVLFFFVGEVIFQPRFENGNNMETLNGHISGTHTKT